eukprot:GHRR01024158.1.p1 GENE.GHRR01024158.1~~GHRR01024158.1.p1  ORF type:complete len:113 (+),score=19.06 GHRR01024158.1:941-1279(+)
MVCCALDPTIHCCHKGCVHTSNVSNRCSHDARWPAGALEYQYPPHLRQGSYAEEGRSVNTLKAGLTVADRIVTVSPGYSDEIKTWLGGWGLEGTLMDRGPVVNGIVNGIDTE